MVSAVDLAKIGSSPGIAKSVGRGGRNLPVDVAIVQHLLSNWLRSLGPTVLLPVDGQADQALDSIITRFQKEHLKSPKPDGRFDPSGKGFATLRALFSSDALPACFALSRAGGQWSRMHGETMLRLAQAQFGALSADAQEGFRFLFKRILLDPKVFDIRWGAYMLATVKAETGTYLPIEENAALWKKKSGKGEYAEEVTLTGADGKAVTDALGKPVKGRYFGRGYVQLTWRDNYLKLGTALGLGDGLARAPERALEPDLAYRICSLGMREGSFTGVGLPRFIDGDKCDYRNARKIINGLDRADEIAGYAIGFEALMMLSTSGPPKAG